MSAPGDTPRRRSGASLSDEDVALWRYVTRGVTEGKGKQRVPTQAADANAMPAAPQSLAEPAPPAARRKSVPDVPTRAAAVQLPAVARPPEPVRPVPLERRKARRIAKGGQEIEARLDLHGLTQDEASRALEHFIYRCSGSGMRTVLVITGKGAPLRPHEEEAGMFERRERGVLRRMVPIWLDGPALRPLVISYASAHARHGGHGALYVSLRRRG